MNSLIFMLILVVLPLIFAVSFIPYWTRKTESFGVSIPESEHSNNEIKVMRRRYAIYTLIVILIIAIVSLVLISGLSLTEARIGIIYTASIFAYMLGSFLIYLVFHKKMKSLKERENWKRDRVESLVIDTKFRGKKLNYSNKWFLISAAAIIVNVLIALLNYDIIPEKIPMNYDFSGEVSNWEDKNYRTVLFIPITQAYMTILFIFVNTVISKAKQQISSENPDESMRKNIIFRRRWSLFMVISGNAMVLVFSLIQLSFIYTISQEIITMAMLAVTAGILIGAVVLSITTGQGGSRVKSIDGKDGVSIDRDDDKYWKLGIFYYNRNDPAIFLEKRFGIGWTNNWAQPLSWLIVILILGVAIGLPLFFGM